tara:strand:+ start:1119 stop:1385 length:267 start_codon:yes stop_codon:yes gene_type:complete
MLMLLSGMASELNVTNDRIAAIGVEIKALAKADADMRRMMDIPCVRPTSATAVVAAIGTGSTAIDICANPSFTVPERCCIPRVTGCRQ